MGVSGIAAKATSSLNHFIAKLLHHEKQTLEIQVWQERNCLRIVLLSTYALVSFKEPSGLDQVGGLEV